LGYVLGRFHLKLIWSQSCDFLNLQLQRYNVSVFQGRIKYCCFQNALGYPWCCKNLQRWRCKSRTKDWLLVMFWAILSPTYLVTLLAIALALSGHVLGDFISNSSGHPAHDRPAHDRPG
jgi:hypothetical protein